MVRPVLGGLHHVHQKSRLNRTDFCPPYRTCEVLARALYALHELSEISQAGKEHFIALCAEIFSTCNAWPTGLDD